MPSTSFSKGTALIVAATGGESYYHWMVDVLPESDWRKKTTCRRLATGAPAQLGPNGWLFWMMTVLLPQSGWRGQYASFARRGEWRWS